MDLAVGVVRAWAAERFGDLDAPIHARLLWRAYGLPS